MSDLEEETIISSETRVTICQISQFQMLEDSKFRAKCLAKLKSHLKENENWMQTVDI